VTDPAQRGLAALQEERVAVGELADTGRERLALLHEVGKKVLSASSLDDLNQLALDLVFSLVRAERAALLMRDAESGEFLPKLQRHREHGPLAQGELRVPRSIVREVVTRKVGILTYDALHDPRFQARPSVVGANIHSALCAPLWDEEQVLGVIYLDSRIQSYAFTREDLVLLTAIANLLAIRLKQDLLERQLTRERVVHANLARYHSPRVVEAILATAQRADRPEVGLEQRDVSILFVDLRGFTHLAESVAPPTVVDLLNEYYDLATQVIFAHGGSVMDYLGDSAMAIFGAPLPQPDHAHAAVRAGLELLRRVGRARGGLLERFGAEARVAVNSGSVVVGTVGAPDRLKYAAVGDAVNVASRLEEIGAVGRLTLGEDAFRRLGDAFACTDLGERQLRGRETLVHVYEIRPERSDSAQGGHS
jgi:adenylate cyclase